MVSEKHTTTTPRAATQLLSDTGSANRFRFRLTVAWLKILIGGFFALSTFLLVVASFEDILSPEKALANGRDPLTISHLLILSVLFLLPAWLFYSGWKQRRLIKQYHHYLFVIKNETNRSLRHLAKALQVPPEALKRQLNAMRKAGLLQEFYLDNDSEHVDFVEDDAVYSRAVKCPQCGAMNQLLENKASYCKYCQTLLSEQAST